MSAVWAPSLTASGIDRAGREKRRMLPISLFRHCHKNPSALPPLGPPPGDSRRGAAATRAPPPRREGRRAENGERGSATTGQICSATDACRSSGPNHSVSRHPPRRRDCPRAMDSHGQFFCFLFVSICVLKQKCLLLLHLPALLVCGQHWAERKEGERKWLIGWPVAVGRGALGLRRVAAPHLARVKGDSW